MSLYGYQKKTKPACWTQSRPVPPPERAPWRENKDRKVQLPPKRLKPIRRVSKKKEPGYNKYKARASALTQTARDRGERDEIVTTVPELIERNRAIQATFGFTLDDTITEVHHFYGRLGRLLLAEWGWHLRSSVGHSWIHTHIEEARKLGYICQAGLWNNYEGAWADAKKKGWVKE